MRLTHSARPRGSATTIRFYEGDVRVSTTAANPWAVLQVRAGAARVIEASDQVTAIARAVALAATEIRA